ncbi:glutamate--tRNA ligase [Candidatus Woesearchaeota archaeon]|nr:glutamate--tRNA ligase [Candidatus Woesearchaeota archaeon]
MELDNEEIRDIAISNANKYGGKPNTGAVLGIILSKHPELKADISKVKDAVKEVCSEVSRLSFADIKDLVSEDEAEPDKKEERNIYGFLNIQEGQRVITAFPPEPSKYPHIGHAKAILLNYMLAKTYNGKFILRFEDTNPTLAKEEFYRIHEDNYRWLGVEPDEIAYASDYMDKFYEYATKLIKQGDAYVCTCQGDEIKNGRMNATECECRGLDREDHMKRWMGMFVLEEGKAVLRMKIDMGHKNSSMRDPALIRIIDQEHARLGKKYRLWPTYDFENSVMDGVQQITHRLRSKEFELRNELQRYIQDRLELPQTQIYEFARFNMEGVESSGRKIRDLIEDHKLLGWDDPRLTTLVALKRRGFTPQAIKDFVLSTGITKAEATLTWDDLIIINKRILDSSSNRYFFIDDPKEIEILGTTPKSVDISRHPDHPDRGSRHLTSNQRYFITSKDYDDLEEGKVYRLIDCCNFTLAESGFEFHSDSYEDYKEAKGSKILHWLPAEQEHIIVKILMSNAEVRFGFAEKTINELSEGDIIQFTRFGFCRLDKKNKDYVFWYTHN